MEYISDRLTLLLASASPRRKELLAHLGFRIGDIPLRKVDESYPADMPAEDIPLYLSRKKAGAYDTYPLADNEIIITADTIVILEGKPLGKPADEEDAVRILSALSGKCHKVVSGVTLSDKCGILSSFSTETVVEFSELSQDDIRYYVKNYRPFDKAGSYGIQEWIGYIGIKGIKGDYYNVMGLPLHDLFITLKKLTRR